MDQSAKKLALVEPSNFNFNRETFETNVLQKPAPVQKTDTSLPSSEVKSFTARDSVGNSNCQVTISGGFVKENVSRLVMSVRGIVLTSGESKPFPIIVNKRGDRAEVEFYAPLPHRYFPLRQFVTSGNNGVTDYMLLYSSREYKKTRVRYFV